MMPLAALLVWTGAASASCNFLSTLASIGSSDGQVLTPRGIATDSAGNVYVADEANNRVQKFNSSGAFVLKFGTGGSGTGAVVSAFGVAVDASGNIYVADTGNNRIQVLNSAGGFVNKFGTSGSGLPPRSG